jgi:hypothetical protein
MADSGYTHKKGDLTALLAKLERYEQNLLNELADQGQKVAKDSMGDPGPNPPSQPGRPPHRQTSRLYEGVEAEHAGGTLTSRVVSTRNGDEDDNNVPGYLEFGTRRMAPRPYMRPAYARVRADFRATARRLWRNTR